MKKLIILGLLSFTATSLFAQHKLEKIWETDTKLLTPESAKLDAKAKIIYVSNIGELNTANTGFISKVGLDGKVINARWVTGLNSTKGLGQYKNLLYAAELTQVAVIDINKGAIIQRIPVEGAGMLNDITVDDHGIVYVSDTKTGKVHRIEHGKPSVYLENMQGANGLLAVKNDLYVLANNALQKVDANKKITVLVKDLEAGPDGIEMVKPGEFVLTSWGGMVYYAKADGSKQVMMDVRDQKKHTADIGFDPATNTVYMPTFAKTLIAYKLTD